MTHVLTSRWRPGVFVWERKVSWNNSISVFLHSDDHIRYLVERNQFCIWLQWRELRGYSEVNDLLEIRLSEIHVLSSVTFFFQPVRLLVQSGLISQPTVFFSHNKPASAELISTETNPRTGSSYDRLVRSRPDPNPRHLPPKAPPSILPAYKEITCPPKRSHVPYQGLI